MPHLFTNNAVSTLASSITNVATSLTVQAGHGALFPAITGTSVFKVTLYTVTGGVESGHEIVKVTARATDVFTIVRAQEGTTGTAWGAGTPVQLRVTALEMEPAGRMRYDSASRMVSIIDDAAEAAGAFEYPGWNSNVTFQGKGVGNDGRSAMDSWMESDGASSVLTGYFGGFFDRGAAAPGSNIAIGLSGYNYPTATNARTIGTMMSGQFTTEFSCSNLTVGTLKGLEMQGGINYGGAGSGNTVAACYGGHVLDSSGGAGFAITTNYGLKIENIAAGTTNIAFQTGTGRHILGDAVSIGSNAVAAASALLDLVSTTKGFKLPVMTTTERNAISSPATGLQVFDSTLNSPMTKNSSGWVMATGGRHAVGVVAGSMRPSVTGGCAALTAIASAANQPDIVTLNFDATTQEYAQFSIPMPKSWNEGTIIARFLWSHAATTTNFGVVFSLQAVAVSNDDAIAVAFGTAQQIADTGGTTNDLYSTGETPAITIAGTPAAEDTVFFRVSRVTGDASDTMAVDARLHGVVLYITTDADTDA